MAEQFQTVVSGELPFQLYVLDGVSNGVPGFLFCEFWLKNGEVEWKMGSNFEPTTSDKPVHYITGDESLVHDREQHGNLGRWTQ